MLFNSISFLIFFPVVCLVYFFVPRKTKNLWLLLSSYYFYMQWNAGYALLILFSTASTFITAFLIEYSKRLFLRRFALFINISANLLILFLFKYYNFFSDSLKQVFETMDIKYTVPTFSLLLPVGISFYTFQALGYSIDVYKKKLPHEKNFINYALFVSFFPQLVAGPIERATNFLPQFKTEKFFEYKRVRCGLSQMLFGFVKKIVVADGIATVSKTVFENVELFSGFSLLISALLFTIQIYFDFSGYSDIAIGAAQILGFDLMQNFNNPYFATSFRDFWGRWHISLSSWFKDYLYIPLGGNRCGKYRGYLNLLIVFAVSGMWHGANFTFLIWGLLHGVYQVIERQTKSLRDFLYNKTKLSPRFFIIVFFKWLFVFSFVTLSYVFFISPTTKDAVFVLVHAFDDFFKTICNLNMLQTALISIKFFSSQSLAITLCALFILLSERLSGNTPVCVRVSRLGFYIRWPYYYLCLLLILFFGAFGQSPFIYFTF